MFALKPLLSVLGPAALGWLTKLSSAVLTPLAMVLLVYAALKALVGDDATNKIFFNQWDPPRVYGVFETSQWQNIVWPGMAAFWALGGIVAALGVIVAGYEWYYSSLNPRARASLMETLWVWILGALALGLYPLWAGFILWANNRIVQALANGIPDGVTMGSWINLIETKTFLEKVNHPGDLFAAAALGVVGKGVLLFYTIFFLIRQYVLILLLWVGPLLGGAALFFRRGAPIGARYWLEFLSTTFVQSLLALGAVLALHLLAVQRGSEGNVSLAMQLEMLVAMMALLPAANLLRTILGLPVGGMGLISAVGAGMITGAITLLSQTLRGFGGQGVSPMPSPPPSSPPPGAGGGGSPPGGVIPMGPGGGLVPLAPGGRLVPLGAPTPSLVPSFAPSSFFAGTEHVRRAREAGAAVGRDWQVWVSGSLPTIDRPGIREIKEGFAAGGTLGGALAAGLMAMGMGDPEFGLSLAPGAGALAGRRVGSAIGTGPALGKVVWPTAKTAASVWQISGELRRSGPGAGAREWARYAMARSGPDIWASWRAGQLLVSRAHTVPREMRSYMVARNWGVPVLEAFGLRFEDEGRRSSGGPSWFSPASGEVRV